MGHPPTPSGVAIDRISSSGAGLPPNRSPFYGFIVQNGQDVADGSLTTGNSNNGFSASLTDSPTVFFDTAYEFETVAVARGGADDGRVLGAVTFSFSVDGAGVITQGPTTNSATASQSFFQAVALWNQQSSLPNQPGVLKNAPDQLPIPANLRN